MKRIALTCLVGCTACSLLSCKEEALPMIAQLSYSTCIGMPGTCGAGDPPDCCASENEHVLTSELEVDCLVTAGAGDTISLELSLAKRGGPAIFGSGLEFPSTASQPTTARACDEFTVREGGNEFRTLFCDRLNRDPDEPIGGGCNVRAHLEGETTVRGDFECLELPLPGSPNTVLSTTFRAGPGAGEFQIENCINRLP